MCLKINVRDGFFAQASFVRLDQAVAVRAHPAFEALVR